MQYGELATPLAQIEAAEEVYAYADGFLQDMWADIYRDRAPDRGDVEEQLEPWELLGTLRQMGLRFERARSDDGDSYWDLKYKGSYVDIILHRYAFALVDETGVDWRLLAYALAGANVILVPDREKVTDAAHALLDDAIGAADEVRAREKKEELVARRRFKRNAGQLRPGRGGGPREDEPAVIDRIAVALREAKTPLSPSEVAEQIHHPNVSSVAAALHQVCAYNKPKRLAGWIRALDGGKYQWSK